MKKWLWIVAITILIVVAFFIGKGTCSDVDEVNKKWQDSLSLVQENHFKALQKERAQVAYLTLELDTCENGLVRELTTEEQLAILRAELDEVKSTPPKVIYVRPKAATPASSKPDVSEKTFSGTFMPAPTSQVKSTTTVSLSGVEFEGDVSGDLGTTITPDRRLVYFLKHYASIVGSPLLNGSKKMTLDSDGYWYYIDPRILSEEEIINGFFTWNVRINDVNWGAGKYDAWLPHENLKPLINDVRGFEYGMITSDDLNKMSQRDSRVWSPNNPSGIFQPLPGISKARNDNNFWHGWNYRTKINYKRVTK